MYIININKYYIYKNSTSIIYIYIYTHTTNSVYRAGPTVDRRSKGPRAQALDLPLQALHLRVPHQVSIDH
jgi:hypothetical protein